MSVYLIQGPALLLWRKRNDVRKTKENQVKDNDHRIIRIEMTSQLWIERKWTDNQDRYWTDTYRRPGQQSLLIQLESDPPSFSYYIRLCLSFFNITVMSFARLFYWCCVFFQGGARIVVLFQEEEGFTAAHKSYSFDSREVNALPALARGFFFSFFWLEIPSSHAGQSLIFHWKSAGDFFQSRVVSSCRRVRSLADVQFLVFSLKIQWNGVFFCFVFHGSDSAPRHFSAQLYQHDSVIAIRVWFIRFGWEFGKRYRTLLISGSTSIPIFLSFQNLVPPLLLVRFTKPFDNQRIRKKGKTWNDTCALLYKDIPHAVPWTEGKGIVIN